MSEHTVDPGLRHGHGGKRRLIAVVCLVTGGLLAWWQRPASMREPARVALLLTHVAAEVGEGIALRRAALVSVSVAPINAAGEATGPAVTLPFAPASGAPEVSPPALIPAAASVAALQIRCRYRVPGTRTELVGSQIIALQRAPLEPGVLRVLDPAPCDVVGDAPNRSATEPSAP